MQRRGTRVLASTTGVEDGAGTSTGRRWYSVTTLPWTWLATGLVACALFAGGVCLFSHDSLHRLWGLSAACAYALGALAILAARSRGTRGVDVALAVILCGAILFPLLWMVAHGNGEPEVGVVARSATTLIKDGTPYRSSQVLANTTNPNQYNPYLPLMAAFGVPSSGSHRPGCPELSPASSWAIAVRAALGAARSFSAIEILRRSVIGDEEYGTGFRGVSTA